MARDYVKERLNESPERVKQRAQRNKARRMMEREHGKAALKGKDIDHKTPMRKGGTTSPGNIRVIDASKNRAWRKGKKGYD
jgi:general stress protein YciG